MIVYRSDKGSNLTPNEVDGNFRDHDDRIEQLENYPELPLNIDHLVQSGSLVTFYRSDSVAIGSVVLPRSRWRWRGTWLPTTAYTIDDVFAVAGLGIYLVLQNHVSEASFDAGAEDSEGAFYQIVLPAGADSGTIYDFGFVIGATAPEAGAVLGRVRLARDTTILVNFFGASGGVETPPFDDYLIDVRKQNVSIGTITIAGGSDSDTGDVTWATLDGLPIACLAGQEITFVAPDEGSVQDTVIANGSFVIAARVT